MDAVNTDLNRYLDNQDRDEARSRYVRANSSRKITVYSDYDDREETFLVKCTDGEAKITIDFIEKGFEYGIACRVGKKSDTDVNTDLYKNMPQKLWDILEKIFDDTTEDADVEYDDDIDVEIDFTY